MKEAPLKIDYFRRSKRVVEPIEVPDVVTLDQAVGYLFESERTLGYYHPRTKRLMKIVNKYRFGDR